MKNIFWGGCLVAVLATGCHSSPTPGDTTTSTPSVAPAATDTAHAEHAATMHHMAGMAGTTEAPAGNSPRAQAMRLHDAAMNQLDALATEQLRLTAALARLDTTARPHPAARLRRTLAALHQADHQMMAWMHQLHEPDSIRQPRTQVDAYWRQQLPVLEQLDQRTRAALDSAKTLR
jgi:hypothetical protein